MQRSTRVPGNPMQRNRLAVAVASGIVGVEVRDPHDEIRTDAEDTLAVRRGRDAWAMLRDAVMERRARGLPDPERITVAPWARGDLDAFIRFWSKDYDGVLPPICGVRVMEGMTGGQDAELVVSRPAGEAGH